MARVVRSRTSPRRGDVCWVALDPVLGSEIKKTRPAIVVSNDAMNRYSQRIVVMPLTSHVDKCFPGEALVTIQGKLARALGDQLRSIDKVRLRKRIDTLAQSDMRKVDEALAVTLALARA
jgi:mRNA interferase MazF